MRLRGGLARGRLLGADVPVRPGVVRVPDGDGRGPRDARGVLGHGHLRPDIRCVLLPGWV